MRYNFTQSEWREIEGFPEYEINSVGIIRKTRTQVLHSVHVGDYETVLLTREGKRYHRSVKRLVNRTFPEFA